MTIKETPSPNKKPDDLNAVRMIREALDEFNDEERERIIRWVRESLKLPGGATGAQAARGPSSSVQHPTLPVPDSSKRPKDVASFVDEKNPRTDIQLAVAIAYYYRFEAPSSERRDEIDATFLREALRLAGRPGKLVKPAKTLNNAHAKGLLDRGSTRGMFAINSVGENLVGMTLPGNGEAAPRARKGARKKHAPRKKAQARKS